MKLRLKHIWLILVLILMTYSTFSQVRFYNQFKTIPFRKGSSNSFDVLVGAKIDPNKEVVLGLGLAGTYNSKTLIDNISFNQQSITLSYNHYLSRKFYFNFLVNFNLLKNSVRDIQNSNVKDAADKIFNRFFVNYEINNTVIILRRLHFSVGMGVVDFASLVKNSSSTLLNGKLPSLDFTGTAALKVYLFQFKY